MAVYMHPGLDKVRVGIECEKEAFPTLCERLMLLADKFGKKTHYQNKSVGRSLYLKKSDIGVDVRIWIFTMYGKCYRVSYEFNACKINSAAAANLQELSHLYLTLIDVDSYDFRSTFVTGHFTAVEIFQDFPGKLQNDLLLHRIDSQYYYRYPAQGSQYCGVVGADSRVILYDKGKELVDKGKAPSPFSQLLRLETKINMPTTLKELLDLDKPFKKVRMFSVERLKKFLIRNLPQRGSSRELVSA